MLTEQESDKNKIVNLVSGLCNAMKDVVERVLNRGQLFDQELSQPFLKGWLEVHMRMERRYDPRKNRLPAIIPFHFSKIDNDPSMHCII